MKPVLSRADTETVEGVARGFQEVMEGGLVSSLAYLAAAGLAATLIHECGHLLAAIATSQREIAVNIGSHGTLIHRRLGEIRLRARGISAPWRPSGSVTFDAARATAQDMAIIAAAGPVASIVGALVTGALVASPATSVSDKFLATMTVTGFLVGFGNLIPFSVREGTRRKPGSRFETDGLQLVHAVRVIAQLRA